MSSILIKSIILMSYISFYISFDGSIFINNVGLLKSLNNLFNDLHSDDLPLPDGPNK